MARVGGEGVDDPVTASKPKADEFDKNLTTFRSNSFVACALTRRCGRSEGAGMVDAQMAGLLRLPLGDGSRAPSVPQTSEDQASSRALRWK